MTRLQTHATRPSLIAAAVVGLIATLLATPSAQAQPAPFDGDPSTIHRIDVSDPIVGGVAVSGLRFPDGGADGAVLATNAAFADALAGASLSAIGPLLLTEPEGLSTQVGAELQRAVDEGGTVVLLGGTGALSPAVADDVSALGFEVDRIDGATRFETAALIAERAATLGPLDGLLLARGFGPEGNPTAAWADAISGSAVVNRPILLTPTDALHPAAAAVIESAGDLDVAVLGGVAAVEQAVEDAIPAETERLAGAARDGTAAAIAERFLDAGSGAPAQAIVFDGWDEQGWAYGLTVATYGREIAAPLLPVNRTAVATATAALIACDGMSDLLVMGSAAVVPDATVAGVQACPASTTTELVLDGEGILPVARFDAGMTPEEVVAALAAEVGPPIEDTGWIVGCPLDSDEANERFVTFDNNLTAMFYSDGGGEFFRYWAYSGTGPDALATQRGLSPNSTNAELSSAYPGATLEDTIFGLIWDIPDDEDGPMLAFTPDAADSTPVDSLYGGSVLFCD